MSNEQVYSGGCACGAVQVEVTGEPEAMGYCHCQSCREWSAGPVNAFTLWKPEAVRISQGAEELGIYNKTRHTYRKWCQRCGGNVLAEHPSARLTDVYAAVIPDLPFQAAVHLNYQETVLRVRDGLPKLKDFPVAMGGSGEELSE